MEKSKGGGGGGKNWRHRNRNYVYTKLKRNFLLSEITRKLRDACWSHCLFGYGQWTQLGNSIENTFGMYSGISGIFCVVSTILTISDSFSICKQWIASLQLTYFVKQSTDPPPMFTVFDLFNEWNRRNKSYTVEFSQVKMYGDSRLRDFPFRKDVSHLSCNLSKCGTAQMIWINKKSLSIRWLMRNTVERENYITFLGNPTFIMG